MIQPLKNLIDHACPMMNGMHFSPPSPPPIMVGPWKLSCSFPWPSPSRNSFLWVFWPKGAHIHRHTPTCFCDQNVIKTWSQFNHVVNHVQKTWYLDCIMWLSQTWYRTDHDSNQDMIPLEYHVFWSHCDKVAWSGKDHAWVRTDLVPGMAGTKYPGRAGSWLLVYYPNAPDFTTSAALNLSQQQQLYMHTYKHKYMHTYICTCTFPIYNM